MARMIDRLNITRADLSNHDKFSFMFIGTWNVVFEDQNSWESYVSRNRIKLERSGMFKIIVT